MFPVYSNLQHEGIGKGMTRQTLILADDLTGALDSAVGFTAAGRKVVVARSPEDVPVARDMRPDVLAVNTSSREIAPEAAAARVVQSLAALDPDGFATVMKKVDSRLKGNITAEVAALQEWYGAPRGVACPAIPEMGRFVEAGALVGQGVERPVPVYERFSAPPGLSFEIADAGTDRDLDSLVECDTGKVLWIGARGVAFALARRDGVARPAACALRAPVMIANGSRDPITLAQIAALPNEIAVFEAPDGRAPEGDPPDGAFVLSIAEGGGSLSGQEAAAHFAESVARYLRTCRPAALLICGGESAQAVLDRIGVNSLQVIAELRPGLPLCEVEMSWGMLQIVTKSGGFGAPDLMAGLLEETKKGL